jgi:hypothetical protein
MIYEVLLPNFCFSSASYLKVPVVNSIVCDVFAVENFCVQFKCHVHNVEFFMMI